MKKSDNSFIGLSFLDKNTSKNIFSDSLLLENLLFLF